MFALTLLLTPLAGLFIVASTTYNNVSNNEAALHSSYTKIKSIALSTSVCTLFVSLIMFALFDFSSNQFQFVQEYHELGLFNLYLGVDGVSIYFVLLTTIIMPISLLSN